MTLNSEISSYSADKPTLVLVHGVAGSLHIWDTVYNALTQDYNVVRIDLLGYGHSPRPRGRYSPLRHVEVIRETLQSHGVSTPFTLVGLSMGATLVLEYARRYPDDVNSLVAIGYPYYENRTEAQSGLRHNLWAGLTIDHPLFARFFVPAAWGLGRIGVLSPRSFAGIYSELQARETLLAPYRVFRANIWGCMVNVDHRSLLADSGNMTRLFIHGSDDEWSPASRVESVVEPYRNSTFERVDGAGHNLVVLEPEKTVELISKYMSIPVVH